MRLPLACLAVALAAPAVAQPSLHLVDPVLSIDGARVGTVGTVDGRGILSIAVPGTGTYRVSDAPFAEAHRVGEFTDRQLVFAVQGTSVRLIARAPIHEQGQAPAYVAFSPDPAPAGPGLARLAVVSAAGPDPAPRGGASEAPRRTDGSDVARRAEVERLMSERAQLRAELDRAQAMRADLAARLVAVRAELDAARGVARPAALAEADALRDRLARTDAGLDALRAEREERDARIAALEAELAAARRALAEAIVERDAARIERDRLLGARREPAPASSAAPASTPSRVQFVDFDFARLQNADTMRQRLATATRPPDAAGRAGDVLVLFQTDATGRVIRTAVPTPLGGGLDALAEDLVREMRFVPPVVGGMATGLRSQVLVRFGG